MKFTIRDHNNGRWPNLNCAIPSQSNHGMSGGWWYNYYASILPNNQLNA